MKVMHLGQVYIYVRAIARVEAAALSIGTLVFGKGGGTRDV